MEQLYRSQETRKFYKKLNASRNGFVPQADMCRGVDGSLLTDEQEVINRWRQHFDEHLNGARQEEQAEDNDYNGERNDETRWTKWWNDEKKPSNSWRTTKRLELMA